MTRSVHWRSVLLILLGLSVLALLHEGLLRRAELRERAIWQVRLSAMVADRQAALERWAQDLTMDAGTVATFPAAVWLLSGEPAGPSPSPFPTPEAAMAQLRTLLATAVRVHGYTGGWVFDTSGRLVAGLPATPPEGVAAAADSVLRSGRVLLRVHPAPAVPAGALVLVGVAVRQPGRVTPVGTVLLAEPPETFLNPLLRYQPVVTSSGEVLLSQREGDGVWLVSPTRKPTSAFPVPLPDNSPGHAAVAGRMRFLDAARDYAGADVWAAVVPIRGTSWGLHAKIDRAEALAPARRSALVQLLVVVAGAAALFGAAFTLWRRQRGRDLAVVAEARARAAELLMHASDPILILHPDGIIREVNDRALELYGRPREWFIGRSGGELRPPELQSRFAAEFRSVGGRGLGLYETEHVTADGRRLPVEINLRRVELEGEQVMLSVVRDLSERHAAARALRESEEKYRAIVENTPDVVARLDTECRYLYISPSIAQYSGIPAADWVGRRPRELDLPRHVWQSWEEAVARVLSDGRPVESEMEINTRQGRRAFNWRMVPEYDTEGRIRAVVNVTRDVTERRRLEEQFLHAQKLEAVGRLAGGVAHDFNNILTAIHGHASLARAELAAHAGPAPLLANELEEIIAAAERAASLTRQLLAFSRRQMLQPRRIDLAATVRALAPMLRRLIGEHVEFHFDIADEPLPVRADPGQIEQILLNLCVNAGDAMENGGRLSVTAARGSDGQEGRHVLLRVADTGTGMTPEVLQHCFEPFFTTKEQGRGTGLGLATVYGIVQQCRGGIEVDTEPGRGTTFSIHLPWCAAPAEAEPPATAAPAAAEPPGAGRTVLLAEDDVGVRRLTERLLTRAGYRVLPATNGREALEVAAREPSIDVLLTDVVMPELGGLELARRLRAQRPRLAIVFMTGYTDDFTEQAAPIDPTLQVVHKPFTAADLLAQLGRAIERDPGLATPTA